MCTEGFIRVEERTVKQREKQPKMRNTVNKVGSLLGLEDELPVR